MKSKIFLLLCFMLIIVSIAGVSASEDINQASSITNDENPNTIGVSVNDMDDSETVTSASDVGMLNQENNGNVWYVNGTQSGGDGSTPETAFNTFNTALTNENIADGDTIMVASGEYKGNGVNVGLTIDKELNIIKYGDDEAIFDGECKYQIFKITSTSI